MVYTTVALAIYCLYEVNQLKNQLMRIMEVYNNALATHKIAIENLQKKR